MIIGFGLAAITIMVVVEGLMSERNHRRAETGAVVVAGVLGIAYFVGMLYAAGAL